MAAPNLRGAAAERTLPLSVLGLGRRAEHSHHDGLRQHPSPRGHIVEVQPRQLNVSGSQQAPTNRKTGLHYGKPHATKSFAAIARCIPQGYAIVAGGEFNTLYRCRPRTLGLLAPVGNPMHVREPHEGILNVSWKWA